MADKNDPMKRRIAGLIAFADRHLWHSLHHNFRVIKPITDRNN